MSIDRGIYILAGLLANATTRRETCYRPGCTTVVPEGERDTDGWLTCQGCLDDEAYQAEQRRIARGYADGLDVRHSRPNDLRIGGRR